MNFESLTSPRQLAFIALRDVHKGAYTDIALDRVLTKANLPDTDRRLVTQLVYGCTRRQRTLDAFIDQLGKKKSHQQPKDLRTILHLGLYQLCFQERIPESAAVNTTVQLAKENGFSGLTGFVNGLLRQYIRLENKGDKVCVQSSDLTERLGILYSFPNWMIQVWLEQFGLEQTEQLCLWMNKTPAIDLRINLLCTSLEEVEAALTSAGVASQRIPHLPQALRLMSNAGPIQNLPGYNEGWWTVQDSSAQLVSHLLDPQPGEVVIDACAAPGGKTTHIAELMKDEGKIFGCDRTPSRLKKLQQNAQRLKLKSIEMCTGDSRNMPQFQNTAHRVLLDAPCSGLGTLHRHADARWRQTPETVEELSVLQKQLVSHTSTFVKKDGVLVYSTCTLHPKENEEVVSSFLAENPNWEIEPPSADSPASTYSTPQGWIKVLPHQQDMDGFFMVRLRKKN
ncbi:16S rRNA (cytosine(967)-C(5))-methyltransferase [Brasilonema octagenarum UFV-E1]|uniref:16S rRNA (cytosine(967)-C(5))-methyltransferase n=1 Tax=Brasilonema sennae CENA114 TaxID=415709 RepID=A0A856MN87_9CYAN|nr:16S rRNA (cytosine(967)-C(5))-methyltransferase [Brasilonema sennae]QDL11574.1 16S rRNA (cytosine(967)-C(5))-methyltransferase [Brasilonema sennae CENA114]QDL18897.1 16S rRNA (cytosine(967)-C(5))-methyltransferase [Brasilonema octagenarum UFV-E1]